MYIFSFFYSFPSRIVCLSQQLLRHVQFSLPAVFWGTEHFMKQAPGVLRTRVGFSGGHIKNPAYREVCTGRTGHAEIV